MRLLSTAKDKCVLEIAIHEGRNRQIRRMAQAVGLELQRLIRTRIGPLGDERLEPGQWRYLEVDEVRGLYAAGASSDGVF
ncbi:unannotated protein [freshwater metagenome]|uniref:Unannotated protein n=1 Tax=freshwater metagenome TaxID=449393 RepID=A0A6J7MK06_9ZZZZ